MIKLIVFVAFLLVAGGLTCLCHKLIENSRYEKNERYFHCRYLLAYVVALVIFCNRYTFAYLLVAVDKIINLGALQNFWNVVLPARRFELVYLILSLILTNILLILGAGIIFMVIKTIFSGKKEFVSVREMEPSSKILHLPWVLADKFYETDEDETVYFVSERGFTMSLWAKKMKFVFAIWEVFTILFLVVGIFSLGEFFVTNAVPIVEGWYLLPMAGFLLFEQIQYFLEGTVEYEAGTYKSEDITDELKGNVDALVYLCEETFASSKALLGVCNWDEMKKLKDGLAHSGLNLNQVLECKRPEILTMLNNQLKQSGVTPSVSFQNVWSALLNGSSVNVRDHIQGEFMIYLAAYINFFVSQKKTFLMLCKDETVAKNIREEFTAALKKINKIYGLWGIADIHSADSNEEMSVLICSYQEVADHKLITKRKDFFIELYGVILTDGLDFCAQGNVYKKMIFAELGKISQKLQYILFSKIDNDSLRNAFEYYTNRELLLFKNDQLQNDTRIMIWAEEGEHKIQRCLGVGQNHSPYLGVSIPLSLVGVKNGLPRVRILSADKKGFHTYQEAMAMSRQEILQYLGCNLDLEKMIQFNRFSLMERDEIEMMILHDAEYNFYNVLWAFMKYGGTVSSLIHVISPLYMLREFFTANLNKLLLSSHDYAPLISYRSGLKQSRFLTLLLELCNSGMSEEALMKKNAEYCWEYTNVKDLLTDCLKNVLHTEEFYNIYECFKFEEKPGFDLSEDKYKTYTNITLTDENIRKRVREKLVLAKQLSKNNLNTDLPILKENIYNYYLRDQVVVIDGYLQRILNINDGVVVTQQTMVESKKEYLQASEFVFGELEKIDECVDMDYLDINMYKGDVERKIYGYWDFQNEISFTKPDTVNFHNVCEDEKGPISVEKKEVQVMQMRIKREYLKGKEKEVTLAAGFIFREIFKTLFPINHMNLYAVIEYDADIHYWDQFADHEKIDCLDDMVHSIVPFIRQSPLTADSEHVSIYFVEYTSLEMGMLMSLCADYMKLFQICSDYLGWYLQECGNKNATYLNLGGDDIAPCFAIEELYEICYGLLPHYETVSVADDVDVPLDKNFVCSFCGKLSVFVHEMKDGRKMCRSCKQQQIAQYDEIKELYVETVGFMSENYHEKFRKNIHLYLKSAETIRKKFLQQNKTGAPDNRRILGVYQSKTHELWIEARGPRNAVQSTMVHELTHAWQFDNLNVKKLYATRPNEALKILEGHATYMEVEVMRKLGEEEYADYLEQSFLRLNDEYGEGYRFVKDLMEQQGKDGSYLTPFVVLQDYIGKK